MKFIKRFASERAPLMLVRDVVSMHHIGLVVKALRMYSASDHALPSMGLSRISS